MWPRVLPVAELTSLTFVYVPLRCSELNARIKHGVHQRLTEVSTIEIDPKDNH